MQATIGISWKASQASPNSLFGALESSEMRAAINTSLGTGADQADILYMAQRTILTGANDDIDLAGVLTNAFGQVITAAEIVALFIHNQPISGADNTTNLTIGGGTNPVTGLLGGTTPTIGPIRPRGFMLLGNPGATGICPVTAGTGDILRVANSAGATINYQIAILARSVA
ncbi:hypothetical protein [Tabrizicola sp. M-4]|uniref:hypothetical protein n=1 Tax=Tabrizicola sp. M-4 TaxID=3055847 RepID=UPI003DA824EE